MITPFGELPNRLARDMSLAEQHEWLARRVTRRGVLGAGLGLGVSAVLVALPSVASADTSAVLGRQLVYGSDPTTQVTIAFAVGHNFRAADVTASAGDHTVRALATVNVVPGVPTRYARAGLSELHPGTKYDYTIAVDGRRASSGTFTTASAGPHAFRFTAFGDQGTGTDAATMLGRVRALQPTLHLFAGDLSYADQSGLGGSGDVFAPKYWDAWIQQNDPVAAGIPWMCVPGNHEMEPGFAMHGYAGMLARVPIGGSSPIAVPVATTFRVGTVGFIGLDSNDVSYEIPANRGWTQDAQTKWLEQTLEALRAPVGGVDFVVAFMHASPYSGNRTHGSEGGIREEWVPLFDRYQVDLVISGHNHCYERTLPIRGGAVVSDSMQMVDSSLGTTYVIAGGGER